MSTRSKPTGYSAEYESGVLLIRLNGEIDHHSAKEVRENIDRELFYYRPATLILDLGSIGFMDSAGLGLILGRYTKAKELGGTVRLLNPTPAIVKLLELAGALKMFPVDYSAEGKVKGMIKPDKFKTLQADGKGDEL
nr:anti-sigma factor antagonist [Clostridia bacterium]